MPAVAYATVDNQETDGISEISSELSQWEEEEQYKTSDKVLSFNQEYAMIGVPLTVSVSGDNITESECSYQWKVGNKIVATNSSNSYIPKEQDLENFISVSAFINGVEIGNTSMYFSKLPVVYIDTVDGNSNIEKETYKDAVCKMQGNSSYNKENTTLYEAALEIKGRGNTTWSYPKKPYKLKLDKRQIYLDLEKVNIGYCLRIIWMKR